MPKNVFSGDSLNQDGEVADANDVNKYGLYGDGSDGSYTSGNNLEPGKVHNFTDFTLNQGDTLSSTASNSGEPIIVKVQGDVDISGTIDLSGQGYAGGSGNANNGKGYNAFVVTNNANDDDDKYKNTSENPVITNTGEFLTIVNKGTGGPGSILKDFTGGLAHRGAPGAGGFPPQKFMNFSTGQIKVVSGTGGGSGGSDDAENTSGGGGGGASYGSDGGNGGLSGSGDGSTGSGGDGGGSMIIVCEGNLSFTGTIDISGDNGNNASSGGAGGGGAGGMFYALYSNSLTDTGSKLSSGGAGGSGAADGGNGGSGTILFESVS